jgi:hydrogenase maturation protease
MNAALVDRITRAVLYEGYMLYPYRPSAVKNRQRFNFGVLYPRSYSEEQGGTETSTIETECLVLADDATSCAVRVRFLRMVARSVFALPAACKAAADNCEKNAQKVDRLEVSGRIYQPWQEAAEEEIEVSEFGVRALALQPMPWPFRLSAKSESEPIADDTGERAGFIRRHQEGLAGLIDLSAQSLGGELFRLTARVSNTTQKPGPQNRDQALALSFVSTHTLLEVRGGEFISLLDPPQEYFEAAKSCHNAGTWPVLVGDEGQRDTMLSSPIILYDYPQVAPESPGDLFDGAEIDEILSLRILAMTEDEKREMRDSDERARQILERTETLPGEQLSKLHGAVRGFRRTGGEAP